VQFDGEGVEFVGSVERDGRDGVGTLDQRLSPIALSCLVMMVDRFKTILKKLGKFS